MFCVHLSQWINERCCGVRAGFRGNEVSEPTVAAAPGPAFSFSPLNPICLSLPCSSFFCLYPGFLTAHPCPLLLCVSASLCALLWQLTEVTVYSHLSVNHRPLQGSKHSHFSVLLLPSPSPEQWQRRWHIIMRYYFIKLCRKCFLFHISSCHKPA